MLWSLFMIYLGGLIVGVLFFPAINPDQPAWSARVIALAWPAVVAVYCVLLVKAVATKNRQVM